MEKQRIVKVAPERDLQDVGTVTVFEDQAELVLLTYQGQVLTSKKSIIITKEAG